jgi:hypothetical protein
MNVDSLSVALKEWDAVCRAVGTGRQTVLLRKGGIHEAAGEFEIEHRQFLLFPTWLHQKIDWIKPDDRAGVVARSTEPDQIELRTAAEVVEIIQVGSRQQIDAIDPLLIYLPPLIDMRFNYRPENPLYLLVVRAYVLPKPVSIQNTIAYAGCKSWVPLEAPVNIAGARPVLDDDDFQRSQTALHALLTQSE